MRLSKLALIIFCFTLLISCDKTETEDFDTEMVEEYLPLQQDKYIIYRLDSTVFTNFGRNIEVRKYQVKHEIDTLITDNLGRPSYRVFRFLRDSAGTQPWTPSGTYFITLLDKEIEVIEENLRVIKMHEPIRLYFSWKGNRHLSAEPYSSRYNFSNDNLMNEWDFSYEEMGGSGIYGGETVNDILTVMQIDESLNAPVTNPMSYGYLTRSIEKYARGIGLVSRDYILWEYQPSIGGSSGFYVGFGVNMWMIENNW